MTGPDSVDRPAIWAVFPLTLAQSLPIAMSGSVQHDIDADGIIGKDNQAVCGFLQNACV